MHIKALRTGNIHNYNKANAQCASSVMVLGQQFHAFLHMCRYHTNISSATTTTTFSAKLSVSGLSAPSVKCCPRCCSSQSLRKHGDIDDRPSCDDIALMHEHRRMARIICALCSGERRWKALFQLKIARRKNPRSSVLHIRRLKVRLQAGPSHRMPAI